MAASERVKKLRIIAFYLQSCRHRLPLLQVHQVINQIFITTTLTIILIVDILIQMWCKSPWSGSLPHSSSRHQRWTWVPADEIRSDGFKVLFFDNIINKTSYAIKDARREPLNATTITKGAPALFILVKRDIAWLALGIMLMWSLSLLSKCWSIYCRWGTR